MYRRFARAAVTPSAILGLQATAAADAAKPAPLGSRHAVLHAPLTTYTSAEPGSCYAPLWTVIK
jgi:hypothetical protein